MNAKIFLLIIGLAGLFSGCVVGPEFQTPELDHPATYRFDTIQADTTVNLGWWELFQDTLLHRLIDTALVNNLDVRTAASRIEEARAFAGFTKADFYPRIDIKADLARGNALGTANLGAETTNIGFAPLLNWEIDFWGKFRRANRAAQQELLATQYNQRAIMVNLIAEVATSYFFLLEFDAKRIIAERTHQTRREATQLIQARFDRGVAAEIDLNQAQIQEAIAQAAIPLYERQIALTEHSLSILLGQSPGDILRDSLSRQIIPPDIPPGLPSELLTRRPDLQEFFYGLAAQHEQIGIAEANLLPSISLTGLLGFSSNQLNSLFTGDGLIWNAGAGLLGPLFNAGKNKRRVEIEKQRYEQTLLQYEQRVLLAFKDVDDALVQIKTYQDELAARVFQQRAADNAVRLSRARYYGGETSYLEVLESERQQFNAALETATVFTDQLISYVNLYKALGGGWLSEEERNNARQTGN